MKGCLHHDRDPSSDYCFNRAAFIISLCGMQLDIGKIASNTRTKSSCMHMCRSHRSDISCCIDTGVLGGWLGDVGGYIKYLNYICQN